MLQVQKAAQHPPCRELKDGCWEEALMVEEEEQQDKGAAQEEEEK